MERCRRQPSMPTRCSPRCWPYRTTRPRSHSPDLPADRFAHLESGCHLGECIGASSSGPANRLHHDLRPAHSARAFRVRPHRRRRCRSVGIGAQRILVWVCARLLIGCHAHLRYPAEPVLMHSGHVRLVGGARHLVVSLDEVPASSTGRSAAGLGGGVSGSEAPLSVRLNSPPTCSPHVGCRRQRVVQGSRRRSACALTSSPRAT